MRACLLGKNQGVAGRACVVDRGGDPCRTFAVVKICLLGKLVESGRVGRGAACGPKRSAVESMTLISTPAAGGPIPGFFRSLEKLNHVLGPIFAAVPLGPAAAPRGTPQRLPSRPGKSGSVAFRSDRWRD